jgi:hypothetical protein
MVKALLNAKATPSVAVNPLQYSIGEAMDLRAQEVAAKCDWLSVTINTIAKAKQDYEGGPFAVMFKVMDKMDAETIESLPIPNSENGNNPALYKIRVTGAKGKPVVKEKNFYNVLSDRLPVNVAKEERISMLDLSMKDPVQYNVSSVPKDIKDMDVDRRKAEISKLEGELATSRKNVKDAFELLFHIRACNSLEGVTVSVMYALDDKGNELNGEDGRECVVENTRTPITITTTVDGRKAKDTTQIGIGSLKKLRPDVALERGGTYQALMDSAPTVKRGTKDSDEPGGNKPDMIATLDKFQARITDIHTFMRQDVWDAKDQAKYLELLKIMGPRSPAGFGDFKISMYDIYTMLKDIFGHEQILKHVEELAEADIVKAA